MGIELDRPSGQGSHRPVSHRLGPGCPGTHNRWFATLWPAAVLFHLAGNGGHLAALDPIGLAQLVMGAIAAAMLIRPRPALAAGLAGIYLLVFWLKSPVVGNHEVILALIGLAVIAAVARSGSTWTRTIAPVGRWILLVAYGFIALSKLNTSFLDPAKSCAPLFVDAAGAAFGVPPLAGSSLAVPLIAVTVAVELLIPISLAFGRSRQFGLVLALCFHFVLALDPVSHVWDFSATLLPLFVLFGPPELHHRLDAVIARVSRRPLTERTLALVVVGATQLVLGSGATAVPSWIIAYPLWLLLGAGVTAAAIGCTRRSRLRPPALRSPMVWRLKRSQLLVVGVAAMIGLGPYVEVRSAASFNMYSNLQVHDGQSNHLFLGSALAFVNRDRPMVEVVGPAEPSAEGSPLAYYTERGLMVPRENLDRYLREHPDDDALVRLDGETASARAAGLGSPGEGGWSTGSVGDHIRYKMGYRRAIDRSEWGRCLRAWGPIG